MINIVPWRSVVGRDNLDKFISIQLAITTGIQKNIDEAVTLERLVKASKATEKDIQMWRDKRALMRRCGYEKEEEIIIRWHGWCAEGIGPKGLFFYIDTTCRTPRPYINYISMDQWLTWLKGQDEGTVRQYNVSSVAKNTAREMQQPKPRAYVDGWEE